MCEKGSSSGLQAESQGRLADLVALQARTSGSTDRPAVSQP